MFEFAVFGRVVYTIEAKDSLNFKLLIEFIIKFIEENQVSHSQKNPRILS